MHWFRYAGLVVAGLVLAAPARAEDFKGGTLTLIVSAGVGGGYGQVGLILSHYMPAHVPGKPTMIVQYLPGAGGLQAANYLYNAAPSDGSYIGLLRNSTTFGQAMKQPGVKYDAVKFQWIGRVEPVINVLGSRRDSGVLTLDDLKHKQLVVGAAGKLDTLYIFPTVMQKMLGYKFKVVSGYRGTNDVYGALERNEVSGMVQPYDNWLKSPLGRSKDVSYLVQFAYDRMKTLPEVPTMIDLARNDDERKILRLVSSPSVLGRNFAAPPKTPKDRVAMLRKAFADTMKDPGFIAAIHKAGRSVEPLAGAKVQEMVSEVLATPEPLVERTRRYLGY
jgi:tripartite-type tricarboxylate transporter receptor subunit TctC